MRSIIVALASCLWGHRASCLVSRDSNRQARRLPAPTAKIAVLHNPVAQEFVLPCKQLLHESVTAFVHVARCAGEMLIDSHSRRATKIICKYQNFIGRFALTEQPLRIRASRADREQFGGDSDKSGKKQLLAIQFRAEPGHGVK